MVQSVTREIGADRLVDVPPQGRVFSASRRVRLGDVGESGELRLDALARYLQDVSTDDSSDAGLTDALGWVVRRTVVQVEKAAQYKEVVSLTTFCSGIGGRWAERRVSLRGELGASLEAATLWVHIDPATGRPLRLPKQFIDIYGEAIRDRSISATLLHDANPPGDAPRRPWQVRVTDLDPYGHVNNAASWEAIEEVLGGCRRPLGPIRAELEYRDPILPTEQIEVAVAVADADGNGNTWSTAIWVLDAENPDRAAHLTCVVKSLA